MSNKESKRQLNVVKKELHTSSVKKGDQSIQSRHPKCKLCDNHGIFALLKGHKRFCLKRDCACEKCFVTLKKRELSAAEIKISRAQKQDKDREEKKKKEKNTNTNEREHPLPLEFNTKYTTLNYMIMKQKYDKFVRSLSETLTKVQYHPMAWLLIPVVSEVLNTILRYAESSVDEDIHIFRSCIDQILYNAQVKMIQYENQACCYLQPPSVRNISYEKSIYRMGTASQNPLQLWSINSLTWPFNSLTSAAQPSYPENSITSPHSDNTSASPHLDNTSASPRLENTSSSPNDTEICSESTPMYPEPSAGYH
ncbi:uncharacterized protein [Linepithema humile]|uniref:uncharacterized protein n=1 Tax=Linepithema humile TaxID=83485 RepID=UPI000623B93D|nr:PREDICTED: uncharacterized protein LOC105668737 [Linepithema humile]XP_012216688.1 PREDICTED: uncharacterized protein LOC105668737 [Linepithema humile]